MKTTLKALTLGIATAIGIAAFSTSASAATPWQREHAREVQAHRYHQDQRINHALRTGRITPWQARHMHREVHSHRGYHR